LQAILKPNLVADVFTGWRTKLLSDALGNRKGSDATRLRVADAPPLAATGKRTDFWQLRGFAGAGFTGHYHDGVMADRVGNLVAATTDRKLLGEREGRKRGQSEGAFGSSQDANYRRRLWGDNGAREPARSALTMLPPADDRSAFVTWLRSVAPYIHAFRGKIFVVAFPGELVIAGGLNALVHDMSLLAAMGMRIVVVHGARPQIEEQLRLRAAPAHFGPSGIRITDDVALECLKEASGEIRLDLEAAFSQGLPNTPMAHSAVRVISGNLVVARPLGVIEGVDYAHTGVVRKVDTETIRFALNSGAIVSLSPLGYSPTGEALNLTMEDVAVATAIALDAEKLIFFDQAPGILAADGSVLREISEADAESILARSYLEHDPKFTLQHMLKACQNGVARAHLVPFDVDGSLLLELFLHDGVGTMLVEETLDRVREANTEDVGGLLTLLRPLEEDGTLVRRNRALIEREIGNFTVVEHDGVIFGCAALYAFPSEGIGEMACLAVSRSAQNQGDGERLLMRIEQRARAEGLQRLFVLTTRAQHWFLKRGFVQADVDALPTERKKLYNWQRMSQIFIKTL